MRVIAGSKKGLLLKTLEGDDIVRPTTDKVKEAVFSSVQFSLEHCLFLDLFAGSGQMGIEALSRGARQCYFVDDNNKSLAVCRQNLAHTGFAGEESVTVRSDFVSFLRTVDVKFDIAFLDPPYNKGIIERALPLLAGSMTESGVIICETSADEKLPEHTEGFEIDRERRYGKIKITYYTRTNT